MSRLLPWCVVMVLAGCTVPSLEELQAERLPVLVKFTPGFLKGCFISRVVDPAKQDAELSRELIATPPSPAQFSVTVPRKAGWPETVKLVVSAHEQTCDGLKVDEASLELRLVGEGRIEGTKDLVLETPDGDGDGYVPVANGGSDCDDNNAAVTQRRYYRDADEDGVGAGEAVLGCVAPAGRVALSGDCDDANGSIRPGATETCNDVDDNCTDGVDEGFDKNWYLDNDSDGYGRKETATVSCAAPSARHVHRTGDCDDTIAAVNPGVLELCNNRDDNCEGGIDETFPNKGMACTDGESCAGLYDCNATQTATFCKAPPRIIYYPDEDGDGEGATAGAAEPRCAEAPAPAGKVTNNLDCDDRDPGTYSTATDICDGLDNNCNNQLDEAQVCGGALRRVTNAATGGNDHDWRTVSVHPSGYPVWIAGMGGKLIRRAALGVEFENHSNGEVPATTTHCGNTHWYASWVRPSDGHVFLAGQGNRVAQHTGTGCINQADGPGNGTIHAMVGFESGTGPSATTTIYLVDDEGRAFTWTPGSTPIERRNTDHNYYALHGVSESLLLVGGRTGGTAGNQHIVEYVNGDLTVEPTPHTLAMPVQSNMNAVWMNAPDVAFAVGDLNAVWRWNGARGWSVVSAPSAEVVNLISVAMPPNSREVLYVVDKGPAGTDNLPGKLYRKTQVGWARAPAITPRNGTEAVTFDASLRDIAMTSVGDFWMVGDNGRVYHYPEQ